MVFFYLWYNINGDDMKVIEKYASFRNVIISLVVFGLFVGLVLPYMNTLSEQYTSTVGSPDTSFSFDLARLNEIRMSYGEEGRINYVIIRWTFDVIWPFVYFAFLGLSTAFLSKKIGFSTKLLYIPIVAVLFDFLENITATFYMLGYPNDLYAVGYILIASSMIKWLFVSGSFLMVLELFVIHLYKMIKNR
jgi:hypothetical protein